jgi:DNA-binding response OmpR family regulator
MSKDVSPEGVVRPLNKSELLEFKLLKEEVLQLRHKVQLLTEKNFASLQLYKEATTSQLPSELGLTAKERIFVRAVYDVSKRKQNTAASKEYIFSKIYEYTRDTEIPEIKIIDVFKSKILKKLKANGFPDDFISTVWGVGYYIPEHYLPLISKYYELENVKDVKGGADANV